MDGLKACKTLSEKGQQTNVTLCFSANQALLAAKAGATYISPFIGRLDDLGLDGMEVIEEIRTIYDNYGFETQNPRRLYSHRQPCQRCSADWCRCCNNPAFNHAQAGEAYAD